MWVSGLPSLKSKAQPLGPGHGPRPGLPQAPKEVKEVQVIPKEPPAKIPRQAWGHSGPRTLSPEPYLGFRV